MIARSLSDSVLGPDSPALATFSMTCPHGAHPSAHPAQHDGHLRLIPDPLQGPIGGRTMTRSLIQGVDDRPRHVRQPSTSYRLHCYLLRPPVPSLQRSASPWCPPESPRPGSCTGSDRMPIHRRHKPISANTSYVSWNENPRHSIRPSAIAPSAHFRTPLSRIADQLFRSRACNK